MRSRLMTLGVLVLAGSGCSAMVLDGLRDAGESSQQETDGATGGQQNVESGTTAVPATSTALAMRYADVPSGSWAFDPSDGYAVDPNTLVLFFVNPAQSCAHPGIASACPNPSPGNSSMLSYASVPSQQFVLLIPPALDKPGRIDLQNGVGLANQSMAATPNCTGGGGGGSGGGSGTLDILSSDENTLSVVLSGTGPALSTASGNQPSSTNVSTFDGTYTVYRCDAPPPGSLSPIPDAAAPSDAGAATNTGSTGLAMRLGDVPTNALNELIAGPGPGGSSRDPNSLVLFVATVDQQCAAPVVPLACPPGLAGGPGDASTPFRQLMLVIPPELDSPGLIDLQADQIPFAENMVAANGAGCGGGGGSAYSGTLNIVSSDPTSLSVVLSGTSGYDGTYAVERCDAPAPPPTPTATIAIPSASLPTTCVPGSTGDPNTLLVFFGTASETCSNPWASIDSTTVSRGVFALPPALQKPGILNLSDPSIAASYPLPVNATLPACTAPAAAFAQGTIQIVSIDATAITFRVSGSTTGLGPVFDGLYAASICP